MPNLNVAQDIRPLSEFRSDAAGMIQKPARPNAR